MKKLTLTSDEENIFFLDSKRIVDTELTLVVSNPDDDADIEIGYSRNLIIESSVIRIVTEDGSTHDYPIYFNGGALVTNSEIEGAIQFETGYVANSKIEGTIKFE